MKSFKYILVALLAILMPTMSMAQDNDIELDAFCGGNFVLLKWYPQSVDVYKKCAKMGFVVERRQGGGPWEALTVVKPGTYEEFAELEQKNDKAFMINYLLHPDEVIKNAQVDDADAEDDDNDDSGDTDLKNSEDADFLFKMCLLESEFSIDMARVMGLNFSDDYVQTQQHYEYRISAADSRINLKSGVAKVSVTRRQKTAAMPEIKVENKDHRVYFSWNMKTLRRDYSGFQIERSVDGKTFKVLNTDPIVHLLSDEASADVITVNDSLPSCDKVYYYRFCGISRFGFNGPYSKVVTASYECPYNVQVSLKDVKINEQNISTLHWEVDNPDNQTIKGFDIERAEKMDVNGGTFVSLTKGKLLPGSARSYVDNTTLESNYYRVVAYGKSQKQVSVSNFYYAHPIDSVPPAAPTGLKATIDSAGVVELTWSPNTEPDIMAYRVFFSNDTVSEFLGASDTFLTKPYFTDTLFLGSLTNEIYYKVLAIDRNYNQGPLSDAIKVLKPDTIPPAPARFENVYQDEAGTIHVEWRKSVSTDVVKQTLYRRVGEDAEWTLAGEWNAPEFPESFIDTIPASGERFYYRLVVADESDNKTERESPSLKTKHIKKECVKDVVLTTDYRKGGIEVSWEKCGCKIYKTNVFRRTNGGDSKLLGTIKGVEINFFDKTVKKGENYQYIIQPITEKMSKIAVSESIDF